MANSEPTTRRISSEYTEYRRKLIEEIRTKADETSRLYGKLVRWKQGKNAPWHYGIGLSNTYLFYPGQVFEVTNEYQYENIRIVNDSDSTTFSPIDVIERLIQALYAFEEKVYDKNFWNDEIFARLIVTNKAIHCKNGTEAKQYKEVEKEFRSHLKIYAPELNPRMVSNKFPKFIVYLLFVVLGFFVGVFCSILLLSKAWDNLGEKITPFFSGLPNFEPIQVLILIVFIVIVFFLLARFFISISNVEWSGFRGQKLWDWLSLLIVPFMLAIGAFFLNFSSEQRQNALNDDQQNQESLKSYLSQVKDILIKDSLQAHSRNEEIYLYQIKNMFSEDYLKNNSRNEEINKIIEAKTDTPILSSREKATINALTQTMLKELDESRKRQVIEFLAKSKLITYPGCNSKKGFKIIDGDTKPPQIFIDKADLKDVDLSDLDLSCVNFDKADLGQTIFDNSDLSNADLTKAKINKDTSFKKAKLFISNINQTGSSDQQKNLPISLQKILTLKNVISNTNRLEKTNILKTKDFNEINIPNLTFKNLNFNAAELKESNLQFTNFINSNLDGVNFQDSDLSYSTIDKNSSAKGAIFSNTNLTGATLKNIDLQGAQFDNANLFAATLSDSALIKASFEKAKLLATQLKNSNLQGANFTEANLESTNFEEANLENVNFTKANLVGANLSNINISKIKSYKGAIFSNTNLTKANLKNSNLQDAHFDNANFTEANLESTNFEKANLENANFEKANLAGANLSNIQSLQGAVFEKACYNSNTKFPANFDHNKHQMIKIDDPANNPCKNTD